jgi:large repetitive protein
VASETDVAGNTGTASHTFTLDTVAPGAPSIVVGDHVSDANVLTLTGTAVANGTVNIYDDATLLSTAVANGSGAWTYTTAALSNGAHSLTATATDVAGNTGTASSALDVSIDNSPPPIPVTVSSFTVSAKGTGLLMGTSEANSAISIYDGNTDASLGHVMASTTGAWIIVKEGLSANSVHNFIVNAFDQTGNTGSIKVLYGTTGNDTINSSAHNEFLFGNGGNDTFVFSGSVGKDTITDFNASNDVLQLSQNAFADFSAVLAHAAQAGSDVTITVDPSNSITLHNTTLSQLTSNNIHLI